LEAFVNRNTVVFIVGALGVLLFLGPGVWAFIDPQGFYDELAPFEPYNEHFIHDIGAFQIGIGVSLAAALWKRSDALFAAFAGAGIGAAFHTAAHFIDHDLGGKDTDVYFFGVMTVALLGGAWVRLRA
jgi:hypothetical protein